MTFEFFVAIKQEPISTQGPVPRSTQTLSYIHHFRVKITYPLHFIIFIFGLGLYHVCSLYDQVPIYAFPLELGYDTEYDTYKPVTLAKILQQQELQAQRHPYRR